MGKNVGTEVFVTSTFIKQENQFRSMGDGSNDQVICPGRSNDFSAVVIFRGRGTKMEKSAFVDHGLG